MRNTGGYLRFYFKFIIYKYNMFSHIKPNIIFKNEPEISLCQRRQKYLLQEQRPLSKFLENQP